MNPKATTRSIPRSEERAAALAREWRVTCRIFHAFHGLPAERRYHHLGLLFEKLIPWLERGILGVTLRHFLLLPKEAVLAGLFARAARKPRLPRSYEPFLLWVESVILADLTDPSGQMEVVGGAQGEPSPELQRRFNRLPREERALLYLYMVEGLSPSEVGEYAGFSESSALEALRKAWKRVEGPEGGVILPPAWRPLRARLLDGTPGPPSPGS